MIFFLLIVQSISQNIVIDPNSIGHIANYSFTGSAITINYNAIQINLPESYHLQNGNSYACNFNGGLCIANGKQNSILVNGLAPQNNYFTLNIFNLENGLLAQNLNYDLEIYLDDLLIDTLHYSYLLYESQQFQVQCIFSSYFTFVQSDLLINFTVQHFVKQSTVLELMFPYINNQDQQNFSMLMNVSELYFQDKELSYKIDFDANTLRIFNLFEIDLVETKEFLLTIKNVYTQNYEYQALPIKFTTIYESYVIYTFYFVDNNRFIPSNPKVFTLSSSHEHVEEYTNLLFFVKPRFGYSQNSMLIVNFKNQENIQIINDAEFIPKTNFNTDLIVNKLTQSFVILNFNTLTDATSFEFELRNVKNPIGDYNLEVEVTIAAANQNRIESIQQNLALQSSQILQYDMEISNKTVFALSNFQLKFYLANNFTKTSIILFIIPNQLNLVQQDLCFQNNQSSDILIEGRKITITGYFSETIYQNYIEINFRAQLAGIPQLTDSFQLFIVERNKFTITQLVAGMEFNILPSSFQIISIQPQIKIADYLTNFFIVLDIPEINFGSQLYLKILDFNLTDSTLCSSQVNSIQNYCKINNQQILIQMNYGGILFIHIYSILTNRFVGQFECQFEGSIQQNKIISSNLVNSNIQYEILEPQTLYQYFLQSSNFFYGEESQITITFFLQSRILPTDILKMIFPTSLANNINCCNNSVISISQNIVKINQLQTGFNTIMCTINNPISDEILSPFEYSIHNLDNQLIVSYKDYFGIQQNLKQKILQFSMSQSSLYYKEVIGLNFVIEFNMSFQINDLVVIIIYNCPLTPLQLEIVTQSNIYKIDQIQKEFYFSEQDFYLILQNQIFQTENLNNIFINGFQLNNEAGIYQVDIQIKHLNKYNQILEENTKAQNLTIKCLENCEKCFNSYDRCTKCSNDFLLYKGSCVFNCPLQTVQVNQTCFDCLTSQDCLVCDKNELQICQKCILGFKLVENYCIQETKIQSNQTASSLQQTYHSSGMTNINNKSFKTSELLQILDQIPIWLIIISGQTIYVSISKCRNKKGSFFKNYYIQIVLLDIPAAILRFVRFALISQPGFFFMAMVSLILTLGLQILGSSQILLLKSSKHHSLNKIKYITVKEQIILLLQWRYYFSLIHFNENDLVIQDLLKLLKVQLISQILPIVFLIAFLSNVEKFYIFVADDIVFNIIVLALSLTKNKWSEAVQISPEQPKIIEEIESLKQGQEIDIIAK